MTPSHLRRRALSECGVPAAAFNRSELGYFHRCPTSSDRRRLVARWLLDYGLTRKEVRALLGMDYTQVRRADEERGSSAPAMREWLGGATKTNHKPEPTGTDRQETSR